MSKRSEALCSAYRAASRAGGSHETIEARRETVARLINHCYDRGFQVTGIEGIKQKHIASFISAQAATHTARSLQNQLSHIRGSLEAAGRREAAKHEGISNKALGTSGASRAGTKTAATDAEYRAAMETLDRVSPGVAAAIMLERELGLRGKEALMAEPSLKSWERALERGERCMVIHGTKGGRDRWVDPPNRVFALSAVRNAIAVASRHRGHLVRGSLEQAITHYNNIMSRHVDITGHQLRYAFAQDCVDRYRALGFSEKSTYAKTSADLGHGDGRGTWIKQVYDQRGSR